MTTDEQSADARSIPDAQIEGVGHDDGSITMSFKLDDNCTVEITDPYDGQGGPQLIRVRVDTEVNGTLLSYGRRAWINQEEFTTALARAMRKES